MPARVVPGERLEKSPILFLPHLPKMLCSAGAWQRPGEAGRHLPFRAFEKRPPKSQALSLAVLLQGLVLFSSLVCLPGPQVSSPTP